MNITVTGANGRMGRAVIRAVAAHERATLGAALVRKGNAFAGTDAGLLAGCDALGVAVSDDTQNAFTHADAIIDFTLPDAMLAYAEKAAELGVPFVTGATGLTDEDRATLQALSAAIPIIWAPNMSVGVTLLTALTQQVSAILGEEYDIEIQEMHHRHKVDAPSGTALALGQAAATGRQVELDDVARMSREGHTGERPSGEIGFASLRGGDVIGDHTVLFAGEGERIELTHKASSRDVFAQGALRAALWLNGKKSGLYSMQDVLGL